MMERGEGKGEHPNTKGWTKADQPTAAKTPPRLENTRRQRKGKVEGGDGRNIRILQFRTSSQIQETTTNNDNLKKIVIKIIMFWRILVSMYY